MLLNKRILIIAIISSLVGCVDSNDESSSAVIKDAQDEVNDGPQLDAVNDEGISDEVNTINDYVITGVSDVADVPSYDNVIPSSSETVDDFIPELVESLISVDTVDIEFLNEVINEEQPLSIEDNTINPEIKMGDLQVDADFNFSDKKQIYVDVDIANILAENEQIDSRAYLSIYSDYRLLPSGKFYPDSASRVLAGQIDKGIFNQSFVASNDSSAYLIEVWFYNGDPPLQHEQQIVAETLTW